MDTIQTADGYHPDRDWILSTFGNERARLVSAASCDQTSAPLADRVPGCYLFDRLGDFQNRERPRSLYIPDQNLFPPFFGLCLAGEARPSGLGLNAGGGGVWDVVGVAGADGDVLGCAVRWGGGDVRRGGIGVGVSGVDTAAEGAMRDDDRG